MYIRKYVDRVHLDPSVNSPVAWQYTKLLGGKCADQSLISGEPQSLLEFLPRIGNLQFLFSF